MGGRVGGQACVKDIPDDTVNSAVQHVGANTHRKCARCARPCVNPRSVPVHFVLHSTGGQGGGGGGGRGKGGLVAAACVISAMQHVGIACLDR